MSATPVITWEGLEIAVDASGDLATVTDISTGRVLLSDLRLDLPEPWARDGVEVLDSEIEQRWEHPEGAQASVRQVFDHAWTLRVQLVNRTPAPVEVPAPRLRFGSPWPTRRWLAGGEASLSIDPGRAHQLVLTQLRGQASIRQGQMLLAPEPTVLPAAGDQGPGQFLVSWRGAWLDDHRQAASILPAWWPDRVAVAHGAEVVLSLPDAAITAADSVRLAQEDEDTWVGAEPGRHVVRVHNRLGTTEVELWWGDDLEQAHTAEALRLLEVTDPRTCEPWEAWIVQQAPGLVDANAVTDYVATAVEERLARGGSVHPLDVMTTASHLARTGADDLWPGLVELVGRLPTVPGSQLALVHVRLLAVQLGLSHPSVRTSRPAPHHLLSAVEQALCRVEASLLAPDDHPSEEAWRVAGLLGAGLPGETVGLVRLAQVHAATALFPEHWDFTERWPMPLALARDVVRQKVLASLDGEQGCEAFGWLLAGL